MRSIIGIAILLLFTQFGYSQKNWTLSECIDYALKNNLELRDFHYSKASRSESLRQSYRDFLPRVNGLASINNQYGRSIDPSNNSYVDTDFFSNNYRLEGGVDLFQGMKRIKTIDASKLLLESSMNDELHFKHMLAFDLMSAYLDVLYFEELLIIQNDQLSIARDNYELVKKEIGIGLKAGSDSFEARSTLLSDSLAYTQSVNGLKGAQLNLIHKMNLPTNEFITLDASSVDEFMFSSYDLSHVSLNAIHSKALSFVPDIKSSEMSVMAAKKNIEIAQSDLYPTVTLFGGYSTGYYETLVDNEGETVSYNDQINNNAKQLIGLSVDVPIFSGWETRSKIEQSKIESLKQENTLRRKKQELREDIQSLILEQNALNKESKISSNNIEAQNLAFITAQKKYENGLISILEFHQAKTTYSESLTDNLLIKFKEIITKSTLGFYYGLPVFKDLIKN